MGGRNAVRHFFFSAHLDRVSQCFSGQWAEPTHAAEGDLSDITKKDWASGSILSGLLVPVIGVETALIGVLMDNKFVIGQGGVSSGGNVVDEIKKEQRP